LIGDCFTSAFPSDVRMMRRKFEWQFKRRDEENMNQCGGAMRMDARKSL
jgi:hypothetical protein